MCLLRGFFMNDKEVALGLTELAYDYIEMEDEGDSDRIIEDIKMTYKEFYEFVKKQKQTF